MRRHTLPDVLRSQKLRVLPPRYNPLCRGSLSLMCVLFASILKNVTRSVGRHAAGGGADATAFPFVCFTQAVAWFLLFLWCAGRSWCSLILLQAMSPRTNALPLCFLHFPSPRANGRHPYNSQARGTSHYKRRRWNLSWHNPKNGNDETTHPLPIPFDNHQINIITTNEERKKQNRTANTISTSDAPGIFPTILLPVSPPPSTRKGAPDQLSSLQ